MSSAWRTGLTTKAKVNGSYPFPMFLPRSILYDKQGLRPVRRARTRGRGRVLSRAGRSHSKKRLFPVELAGWRTGLPSVQHQSVPLCAPAAAPALDARLPAIARRRATNPPPAGGARPERRVRNGTVSRNPRRTLRVSGGQRTEEDRAVRCGAYGRDRDDGHGGLGAAAPAGRPRRRRWPA